MSNDDPYSSSPVSRTRPIIVLVSLLGLGLPIFSGSSTPASAQSEDFRLEEATIADIHSAFESGELTCQELVGGYLDRAKAYDEQGPEINSLITTNSNAMSTAAELDAEFARSGPSGPLHCIPVILKDNYDTTDMPTTGGSLALEGSIPPDDAHLVEEMRDAGAIMLAKANMGEFAHGGTPGGSSSSLGGQTINPYKSTRGPDDSSGGTGAGIAANFGTVGTGTDTLGSLLGPAGANGIVSIKPTLGTTGRSGIIPFALTFDSAGPMARTVEDAAITLGPMSGVDPDDPSTRESRGKLHEDYTQFLDPNGLKGARIGVARDFFGGNEEVDANVDAAIEEMERQGATVVDPVAISSETLTLEGEIYDTIADLEFKSYLNDYLASLGPDAPVKTLSELLSVVDENNHSVNPNILERFETSEDRGTLESPYYQATLETDFQIYREEISEVMKENDLDALVSPTNPCPAGPLPAFDDPASPREDPSFVCDDTVPSSKGLDNFTGYPQISVPAGFTSDGLPTNVSFLGTSFSEPKLIEFAYSYEQATQHRRPPESTPPLSESTTADIQRMPDTGGPPVLPMLIAGASFGLCVLVLAACLRKRAL